MRAVERILGLRRSGTPFLVAGLGLAGQLLTGRTEAPTSPPGNPEAQIILQSPSGGETIAVGGILHIRWKLQGKGLEEINAVNIEVSPDSGKTWIGLLT